MDHDAFFEMLEAYLDGELAAAALALALWLPRADSSVSIEAVLLAGPPQPAVADDLVGALLDAR